MGDTGSTRPRTVQSALHTGHWLHLPADGRGVHLWSYLQTLSIATVVIVDRLVDLPRRFSYLGSHCWDLRPRVIDRRLFRRDLTGVVGGDVGMQRLQMSDG